MTQNELRSEFERLQGYEKIEDCQDLIKMHANFMMLTMKNHHSENILSPYDGHGKLILQMVMTKIITINTLLNGLTFIATDGSKLDKLLDPIIFGTLIRNTYETIAMFNLIYRSPITPDEKKIMYNLWVIAGLKYRQRFEADARTEENIGKLISERKHIQDLITEIESNKLYKSLENKYQQMIQKKIKNKDYLIRFVENRVEFLNWGKMLEVFNLKIPDLFKNTYTYLSLYAHPSHVSVFQFGDMFNYKTLGNLGTTKLGLMYFGSFISFFVSDFIHVFPYVKKTYEQLPLLDQIMINFPNLSTRGDEYSINDSWKALG